MSAWVRELQVQLITSTSIIQGQSQGAGLSYWILMTARLKVSLVSKLHKAACLIPLPFIFCVPTHSPIHSSTHPSIHPPTFHPSVHSFAHPAVTALRHLPIYELSYSVSSEPCVGT